MSSPCAGPRLIRCRVRDLASCFYACRLPLEEDHPDILCSKSPEISTTGSVAFDSKGAGRGQKESGKMSSAKKMRGQSVGSSSYNINRNDEPCLAEEEYIVFCFGEDGAVDMINEGNSYDENNENDNITTAAVAAVTPVKGDERGSKETDTDQRLPDDEIKEIIKAVEQPNPGKMDCLKACDSNVSDTSTSSFAFPVLGMEWIGSPVHMPKSGKHDDRSVRLNCCRF